MWQALIRAECGGLAEYPVIGCDRVEAMKHANRLAPVPPMFRHVVVNPLVLDSEAATDKAAEQLETAWSLYSDYAADNDSVSDAEYDAALDSYYCIADAVYATYDD